MAPIFTKICFFLNSIASVIGVLASVFIVAANLLDWAKGRRLNTCDRILVAMGMSGACFQCILVADNHVPQGLRKDYAYVVLNHLLLWTGYSSYWLSACLCVFYCVKILDFNYSLFIWLKLRISKIVPWMLLGSVVGPMVLAIPVYWTSYTDFPQNSTTNHTAHFAIMGDAQKWIRWFQFICCTLGFCVPLVFGIASIALILTSLQRHTQRMKENSSGFSQPRLEAHFGAAKVLVSLLVIYIFLVLAEWVKDFSQYDLADIIFWLVLVFSLPGQPIILILGNTKLRQHLWTVLSPWRK